MEIKYSTDRKTYKRMTTEELKNCYMLDGLFKSDELKMFYVETDRAIIGSVVPVSKGIDMVSSKKEMATEHFCERRELGIINIGNTGKIIADGKEFLMENKDCLYLGRGTKNISFVSMDKDNPARYYFASYPAHTYFPTQQAKYRSAEKVRLGSQKDANSRTINKYIHLNGIKSCQLVMGLTELDEGSVWNTMPVHTHQRRSEVYMYFNIPEKAVLFHLMGEPTETRHLVIRDGQAVASPIWSIHSGVATTNYSFIWAMGGENQEFDDMDWVKMEDIN